MLVELKKMNWDSDFVDFVIYYFSKLMYLELFSIMYYFSEMSFNNLM